MSQGTITVFTDDYNWPVAINPDNVRLVKGIEGGVEIFFDERHSVSLSDVTVEDVSKKLWPDRFHTKA